MGRDRNQTTKPRRGRAVGTVALVAAAAAAAGQARAAQPLRLSLSDAVRLALSDGAVARIAELKVDESRAGQGQARSALLPQVGASAYVASDQLNMATLGISLPGTDPVIGPYGVYEARLSADLDVVNVAALRRYRAARQGVKLSAAERQRTDFEVAAAVSRLYVAVQRADASVAASRATVDLFGRLRDLARDQWRAGVATRLDSLRAEVQLSRERQTLVAAASRREEARLALLRALGGDLSAEVVLTDSLANVPRDVPAPEAALVVAWRARPELLAAHEAVRATGMQASAIAAERLPSLGVHASGAFNGSALDELDGVRTLAAVVRLPIFTGGRTEARLAAARTQEREADIRRREVERQIEEEVRRALSNHTSAADRLALAEQNLKLAEQELDVAANRFGQGVSTSIEVDNAQSSLSAARQARVTALADEAQAWIEVARSMGRVAGLPAAERP